MRHWKYIGFLNKRVSNLFYDISASCAPPVHLLCTSCAPTDKSKDNVQSPCSCRLWQCQNLTEIWAKQWWGWCTYEFSENQTTSNTTSWALIWTVYDLKPKLPEELKSRATCSVVNFLPLFNIRSFLKINKFYHLAGFILIATRVNNL